MMTLHDILYNMNNADLAYRLKLLGVKPLKPKKAEMVAALTNSFAGEGLKTIWASLNSLQQSAVAEACYSFGFSHNETQFQAKYGSLPSFCELPESEQRYNNCWKAKYATRLNLLLFSAGYDQGHTLPEELAERLIEFVPRPKKLTVPTLTKPAQEDDLYIRLTEHEALAEVKALLRLSDQGQLRISAKTAMPTAAGCKKITACLTDGDFFPPELAYVIDKKNYQQEIGPIKPVAWSRLLKNGRYIDAKSQLTASGIKALSLPPHELIYHLWSKWISNSSYDEFNRVSAIKGQNSKGHMTAKPPRRDAITDALLDCPVNQWIGIQSFSNYMQAIGLEFDVTNNPWKLYLCERQYGNFGFADCGEWNIVQLRYIFTFLFEYAAPLGLIDIAFVHPKNALNDYRVQWGADGLEWLSRYDGLRAFRITNLGAFCLGISDKFTPTQPISSLKLEVLSNLSIRIISGKPHPAEKLLLDTWAEPVTESTWKLDAKRAYEAVERGQSTADFITFLSQCDEQRLPETVEGFLKICASDGTALRKLGEAQLFECRDTTTAAIICRQKELKNSCFRISETQVVVPSAHVVKFRKAVKSLGLGIV